MGGFRGAVLSVTTEGQNLYVAGGFTNAAGNTVATNIAMWNGSQWSALGAGLGNNNGLVYVVHFHQGALYAGGTFTNSGTTVLRRLARWDGNSWNDVGGGTDGTVGALASQDGNLYVGGTITTFGSVSASGIARWDGANWFPLGSGVQEARVTAIGVAGGLVYVGGSFTTAGGSPANRFAIWNGTSWATTGPGMNGAVSRIKVVGTNVYVGGEFTQADDIIVNHVGVWDGTRWSGLGRPDRINGVGGIVGTVRAVAAGSNDIYVGGTFTGVGQIRASRIARFDGAKWWPLGSGVKGVNEVSGTAINAIAVAGTNVYVGGVFTNAGGITASNIARWDGSRWWPLGGGIPGTVSAIATRGNEVFVGGTFTMDLPPNMAFNLAKWDGASWSHVPAGAFMGTIGNFFVNALAVQGNYLYVGGSFMAANFAGQRSTNIVCYDGSGDWIPMGTGVNSNVNAITVIGTNVYVAGRFSSASGVSAGRIARWNGSTWSAVGGGVSGTGTYSVSALARIGNDLYAGGNFTTAGGVPVNRIAKWDGTNWSGLGNGITRTFGNSSVVTMASRGNDLYAGGSMEYAGGKASYYLARWNDQVDFDFQPVIRFSNFQFAGSFQSLVSSTGATSYIIEASTNLSQWTPIRTNFTDSEIFHDPASESMPKRFYRARQ